MLINADLYVAFLGNGERLWSYPLDGLARMIIDSAIPPVFWRLFLLTTLLSMASKKNCMNPMKRGVAGMDAFAAAVAHWGSQEHEGKRARHTYYMALLVIFVWLEVALPLGRQSTKISLVGWNPTCFKKKQSSHTKAVDVFWWRSFTVPVPLLSLAKLVPPGRDVIRMQCVMDTASRYLCKTQLSQMKAQHIKHSDLRALLQVPPLQAAMEREQMRWLGHISCMTPDTSTTHARTFARDTIDVGNFVRQASSDGGRISADSKSLPEVWVSLCVEQLASDPSAWNALLDQRVAQALFEDRQLSHSYPFTLPNLGSD